jgi:hypothetical protein
MNSFFHILSGMLIGIVLTVFLVWRYAPGLMFKKYRSPYDVVATIEMIKNNVAK